MKKTLAITGILVLTLGLAGFAVAGGEQCKKATEASSAKAEASCVKSADYLLGN